MQISSEEFSNAMRRNAAAFGIEMQPELLQKLETYYGLVLKWNPRLHLVAPCAPADFATRHILESLLLLKHLTPASACVDIGSGAGLPIIPCLFARHDLSATLIESSHKKAIFLREALRPIQPAARAQVITSRFEDLAAPEVAFVTCRALDRFAAMLPRIIDWAPPKAGFLFFCGRSLLRAIECSLSEVVIELVPQSEGRFLIAGRRR